LSIICNAAAENIPRKLNIIPMLKEHVFTRRAQMLMVEAKGTPETSGWFFNGLNTIISQKIELFKIPTVRISNST
jgi:hypothetical protein